MAEQSLLTNGIQNTINKYRMVCMIPFQGDSGHSSLAENTRL